MLQASSLQNSILLLSLFSLCLSAAILGTASHVLYSYNDQQATNPWWLPIWPSHFDARGLQTLIGASASIVVLNLATCIVKFFSATAPSATRFIILAFVSLSAVAAVVEIAYPAVINKAAPGTDSMQTWTCQWASIKGSPADFGALCHESRFAYFASIPVFVTQLIILGLAVQNLFASRWQTRMMTIQREQKGEELGSIMAAESVRGTSAHGVVSGKGSPEMQVYDATSH